MRARAWHDSHRERHAAEHCQCAPGRNAALYNRPAFDYPGTRLLQDGILPVRRSTTQRAAGDYCTAQERGSGEVVLIPVCAFFPKKEAHIVSCLVQFLTLPGESIYFDIHKCISERGKYANSQTAKSWQLDSCDAASVCGGGSAFARK